MKRPEPHVTSCGESHGSSAACVDELNRRAPKCLLLCDKHHSFNGAVLNRQWQCVYICVCVCVCVCVYEIKDAN